MPPRIVGLYEITRVGGEEIRAFIPSPLPPVNPALRMNSSLAKLCNEASAAVARLNIAAQMVPSTHWFLYGFVRKEAVISSQIEGTQATLEDVVTFEAARQSEKTADILDICNYVDALTYARKEMANVKGLPLCTRLLYNAHARLMKDVRGSEKQPGRIRTSQNWIGGSRPGNAQFVPPPSRAVPEALANLEKWIHSSDPLPPLVKAGLAHVQFETIHPFLDGNGRIGRLMITLLLEHWGLLSAPLLYLSLAFKRHRQEYYKALSSVRLNGDWEGWTKFFLQCVCEAAEDAVNAAQRIFTLVDQERRKVANHPLVTVPAIRLYDCLLERPMISLSNAVTLLKVTKPTASKAIDVLCKTNILSEVTNKRRDRLFVYRKYLNILSEDTQSIPHS